MEVVARAAVVAVGDELLHGDATDTNSGEISRALAGLGIETDRFVVLGDARADLARTFYELASTHAFVIVSGGLGPTLDDVTREAAADAAGVGLVRDEAQLALLRQRWEARGRGMPESNARQAEFPVGAQIMANPVGTAPGFRVWIQGGVLAALPGPPREMRVMLERELLPWIERTCGRGPGLAVARLYLAGLAESTFADRAGAWMERGANPLMGVTAQRGVLSVTLRARALGERGAQSLLEARLREVRERFAAELYSEEHPSLARAVGRALIERGVSVATAESCTGGGLARALCATPGISAVFREGWVTYSNESKRQRLGVPTDVLERFGAVSEEVARAMAEGAARASAARAALAVTGLAGPGGGTDEKPVGLVWLGLCVDGVVSTRELRLPNVDRATVQDFAVHAALDFLRRNLPCAAAAPAVH